MFVRPNSMSAGSDAQTSSTCTTFLGDGPLLRVSLDPAMAAADPPAGLMDIASTLSQDEIPFKLRCATCNKLAVNAFRLPCCDQSICEPCQASLPDTCSVCAHTPLSPDLCKPNKALRTTLKAFLRTEEKKREKERQSAAPVTPVITTPAENDATPTEPASEQKPSNEAPNPIPEAAAPAVVKAVETTNEAPVVDAIADTGASEPAVLADEPETNGQTEPDDDQAPDAGTAPAPDTDAQPTTNGDKPAGDESAPKGPSEQPDANMMNAGPGGFPDMGGWNGNTNFGGMNPYMANPMFNFPNGMGMPMSMDQMAANQGMYGMNMTGMGMMGMNFNGQGMYGSSGWDGSQQNMWQGGQDVFNPNAFANGTGPPYGGGGFGGSNMSYPSNSDYQSGYYGPGYGRGGGYRGRGRGYYPGGPGRGGFGGPGQGHFAHSGNSGLPNGLPAPDGSPIGTNGTADHTADSSLMIENAGTDPVSNGNAQTTDGTAETATESSATNNQGQQLQGIPTIDSLDQGSGPVEPDGYQNYMGPGYGRGRYMRGPMPGGRGGGYWGGIPNSYQPQMPQHPGVEGAPAAPRAMRQGLPNTSVLRQRGFHAHGKASVSSNTPTHSQRGNSEAPQDAARTRSPSKAPSQAQWPGSRSRSPSQDRASRARSPDENRDSQKKIDSQGPDTSRQPPLADRRSRSPSRMSSRRSPRRRDRDEDRDRRSGHRSHRSRRHRSRSDSRSRSPVRNGDSHQADRLKQIVDDKEPNGHSKVSSDTGDRGDLASRISNGHRSGRDGHGRREEERERDRDRERERERDRDRARDTRRRDRDREQDRRDRDRDSERDRRPKRDRERERERDRERDRGGERERDRGRERGADRERERKRRRDRSESPNTNANDRSSQPQARRVKTNGEERNRDQPRTQAAKSESEKDPYTLEREARNRERLLREQQNRGSVKSSNSKSNHRRDSRQERLVGGRRINYKYEDELEMQS
ncbi:hypothetical protein F1880_001669 [Penicillium rolfsii]|nr:hypothetical protein F1880_001669 [Penicillium rolfsii]